MRRNEAATRGRPEISLFMRDMTGGGAERVMLNLATGFAQRGLRVDLVLVQPMGAYLEQVPEAVRLVVLEASRTATSLLALRRYLRESGTPVVISALHHANLALLLTKKLFMLRVRTVPTIHNTLSIERRHARTRIAQMRHRTMDICYGWADQIVAVSGGVADDFISTAGVPAELVETIYNPVITDDLIARTRHLPEHPWFGPNAPPVILGIGRLTAQKDFETLLRAFARIAPDRNVRLMILGEGDARASLERLAEDLGMAERVALPGFVPDPHAYLGHARLFVLSSAWEGLPTVLIEALAAGVPIVSTDCPSGPREILRGGAFGRLVPVGDPDLLADAMAEALDEEPAGPPEEAWKPYTWDASIDAYLGIAGVAPRA